MPLDPNNIMKLHGILTSFAASSAVPITTIGQNTLEKMYARPVIEKNAATAASENPTVKQMVRINGNEFNTM